MSAAERFPAYAQSVGADHIDAIGVRAMDHDAMPYEQCDLVAMVNTSNADGLISEGFGSVRIRSLDGRSFAVEITGELSGLTITAVLDYGRPARARAGLQRDDLTAAIERASGEQGMPVPIATPE